MVISRHAYDSHDFIRCIRFLRTFYLLDISHLKYSICIFFGGTLNFGVNTSLNIFALAFRPSLP